MLRVKADGGPVIPASLAFLMSTLPGNDLSRAIGFFELNLAYDAKGGEGFEAKLLNGGDGFIVAADSNAGFLIAADKFITTQRLKGEKNGVSQGHKLLPFCFGCLPVDSRVDFGKQREVNALDVLRFMPNRSPCFLCGVDEDGGEQQRERVEDFVESGLAASARRAIGGVAIQAVFEQVHIDAAHLNGAEVIKQGEGAMIGEVVKFFGDAGD